MRVELGTILMKFAFEISVQLWSPLYTPFGRRFHNCHVSGIRYFTIPELGVHLDVVIGALDEIGELDSSEAPDCAYVAVVEA